MTYNDAFLRAILEAPDDDAPRLLYADWLEEQGNPRGEFIRAECLLEQNRLRSPRGPALELRARNLLCISDGVFKYEGNLSGPLEARDEELLAAHGQEWASTVKDLVNYWGFRRGFVGEVGMTGRQFIGCAEELFRSAPVRHVAFSKIPPVFVATLASSAHLARLRSMSLAHNRIGPRGARCLADCPQLAGLSALDLTHCVVGDAGLEALVQSPHLAGLIALELWNNNISDSGGRLLASPAALPRLKHLSAGCNLFGDEGRRALCGRFGERVVFGLYGGEGSLPVGPATGGQ